MSFPPYDITSLECVRILDWRPIGRVFETYHSPSSVKIRASEGIRLMRHALLCEWPNHIIERIVYLVTPQEAVSAIVNTWTVSSDHDRCYTLLHGTTPAYWERIYDYIREETFGLADMVSTMFKSYGHMLFKDETWPSAVTCINSTWDMYVINKMMSDMAWGVTPVLRNQPDWLIRIILQAVYPEPYYGYDEIYAVWSPVDFFTSLDTPFGNYWRAMYAKKEADPNDAFTGYPWYEHDYDFDSCVDEGDVLSSMIMPSRRPVCNLRGFLELSRLVTICNRRGTSEACTTGPPLAMLKKYVTMTQSEYPYDFKVLDEIEELYALDPPPELSSCDEDFESSSSDDDEDEEDDMDVSPEAMLINAFYDSVFQET